MKRKFDLLKDIEQGGCSAKMEAGVLDEIVSQIPLWENKNLLVGSKSADDAAVLKLNEQQALIQTTDFFPPICQDPFEFGEIAAANALSDIYAMGGEAILALNLVMFPYKRQDIDILKEILAGGAAKCKEAQVSLAGGHTINDKGIKYGLAVSGIVHPQKIITNQQVKSGDLLILTKAIGTGTIVAGKKLGEVSWEDYNRALQSMKLLNKWAALTMQEFNVRAATDITGFSLLGHALRLAKESAVCLEIDCKKVPLLQGAYDLVDLGCIPGASFRNLKFVEPFTHFEQNLDYNLKMLLLDPQTSGGILMAVSSESVEQILNKLQKFGYNYSTVIGQVTPLNNRSSYLNVY